MTSESHCHQPPAGQHEGKCPQLEPACINAVDVNIVITVPLPQLHHHAMWCYAYLVTLLAIVMDKIFAAAMRMN